MVTHTALLHAVFMCTSTQQATVQRPPSPAQFLSGEAGAVEKYLGFLHAGGSDYSLNILKNAGVDLNTPQPVTVTLQKFAAKLKELKALLGK